MDSRTIRETRVDEWRGMIDAAADWRDQTLDKHEKLLLVAEVDVRRLEAPFSFDGVWERADL